MQAWKISRRQWVGIAAAWLFLAGLAWTQLPIQTDRLITKEVQLITSAQTPVSGAGGFVVGNAGPATYFYWIVAIYPAGNATPTPVEVDFGPNTLTASNFITLNWSTMPGATGYDVLKTTTRTLPTGTATIALSSNQAGTTINDQGGALSPYTVTTPQPGIVSFDLLPNGFTLNGILPQPPVSAAAQGRIWYDPALNCFKESLSGAAYVCIGTGAGSVTSFSAGNLNPLFTTSVATPNTTPALSFAQISQAQNLVFASPNGAPGLPTFRALVFADLPPGTGTVTSVGLALPVSVFSISGSPVTTTGTLTGAFINQTANTVFAGPPSGVPAVPTFRTLVVADLPPAACTGSGLTTNVLIKSNGTTCVSGSVTDAGGGATVKSPLGLDVQSGPHTFERPNDNPGTAAQKTVKFSGALVGSIAAVTVATTADTNNVVGCLFSGAGNVGNAEIIWADVGPCLYDNQPVTAGHVVGPSPNVGGTLTDLGTSDGTTMTGGPEILGIAQVNAAACGAPPCGPYSTEFGTADVIQQVLNARGTRVEINAVLTKQTVNFGNAPAAQANNILCVWQSANVGALTNASCEVAVSTPITIINNTLTTITPYIQALNESIVGTQLNHLAYNPAQFGSAQMQAKITPASAAQNGVVLGVVVLGPGTVGFATIQTAGPGVLCAFDGPTVQDQWVQPSTTIPGDCHATGSTVLPAYSTGQVLGKVETTNGAAGVYPVDLFSPGYILNNNIPTTFGGPEDYCVTNFDSQTGHLGCSDLWHSLQSGGHDVWFFGDNTTGPFFNGDLTQIQMITPSSMTSTFEIRSNINQGTNASKSMRFENGAGTPCMDLDNSGNVLFWFFSGCGGYDNANIGWAFASFGNAGLLQKFAASGVQSANLATTDSFGAFAAVPLNGGFLRDTGAVSLNTDGSFTFGDYGIPSATATGKIHSVGGSWPCTSLSSGCGQVVARAVNTAVGAVTSAFWWNSEVRGGAYGIANKNSTGLTTAQGSFLALTVGGSDQDFLLSMYTGCTGAAATVTLAVAYTDAQTNSAVTFNNLAVACPASTARADAAVFRVRAKSATTITFSSTITGAPTYTFSASIDGR